MTIVTIPGEWAGRRVPEICCKALIHLRVQENSVKKSANAIFKVHEDSVLHLIDTSQFHIHAIFPIHVNKIILFREYQSDAKPWKCAASGRDLINAAIYEQFPLDDYRHPAG